MKTKILIVLIILVCLGVGGFFVYKALLLPEKEIEVKEEILEEIPEEEIVGEEIKEEVVEEKPKVEEKVPEKIIPQAYQLDVPRVYTGEILREKGTKIAPQLCYLGALAMLVLFDDPSLDFADLVAYSGVGVTAENTPPPLAEIGLINGLVENSIITTTQNLGYNFGLGLLSGGIDSWDPEERGYSFKKSAKEVKYFDNEEKALGYLKNIISLGKPLLVFLDLYYVTDDFAKYSLPLEPSSNCV